MTAEHEIYRQNHHRYSFKRVQHLERHCLAKEYYSTRQSYLSEPLKERMRYVYWLEQQVPEFISVIA